MSAADEEIAPGALRDLLDQALAAPPLRLLFPPPLERRFERESSAVRWRYLRIVTLVVLCVYNAFLFDDLGLVPDIASWAIAMRLLAVTPAAFLALSLLGPDPAPAWREGTGAFATVLLSASIAVVFLLSHAPEREHYLYGINLVVVFANAALQLRFGYALAASSGSFASLCIAIGVTSGMPGAVRLHHLMTSLTLIVLTLIGNYRLEQQLRRAYLLTLREQLRGHDLSESNDLLRDLSNRDALTGLANRRLLDETLRQCWQRCAEASQPLSVLMVDVDHFKAYNDRYGHLAGDACLQAIAAILRMNLREPADMLARYGGEEFVAVLPGQDISAALAIGERARAAVETAAMPHAAAPAQRGNKAGIVTISLGVASAPPYQAGGPAALLAAADSALYAAKQRGRNRASAGRDDSRSEGAC